MGGSQLMWLNFYDSKMSCGRGRYRGQMSCSRLKPQSFGTAATMCPTVPTDGLFALRRE